MKTIIANEKITAKKVRLVHNDLQEVMAITEALKMAEQEELDLVQVSDQDVPVVKIMDLNKYKFEKKQADKNNKKKQRSTSVQVKEIQFSYNTQENDLNTKFKSASKFISEGKQVRVVMKMIGRNKTQEIINRNVEQMDAFLERFSDIDMVQKVTVQGNNVTCIFKSK